MRWEPVPKLLAGERSGGGQKAKSFSIPKGQIFDMDNFLPPGPSSKLALSLCLVLSGILFICEEKNDVSGDVIFNATLLDFTVK